MLPERRPGDKPIYSFISNEFTDELPKPAPPRAPIADLFLLKNKVCVVTGLLRGIGYSVAELYAESGALVAFVDYLDCTEVAEKVAEATGARTKAYRCDVLEAQQVESTIEAIVSDFGRIDVFVANAGVVWKAGNICDEINKDDKEWHKLMGVNLNGVYYCAKEVGKVFKDQGKGSFIITASMLASIVNYPMNLTPYNTSKAAVRHLAKSLAIEWAGFARVNSISPGYCDTGLNDHLSRETRGKMWSVVPLQREATPWEVATAYVYLASDAASYVTGTDLVVDGGYTCI